VTNEFMASAGLEKLDRIKFELHISEGAIWPVQIHILLKI